MLTRLSRFRSDLRVQIALLGIGGVLLLGTIFATGSHSQARYQEVADRSAALRSDVEAVATDIDRARQIETEFLLRRREGLIAQRQAALARAAGSLEAVERAVAALPPDDPLRRADVIRAGLDSYATRFDNVAAAQRTLGLTENDGLQGRLRRAVHAAETRLAAFDEPRLTALMLMMRRHEKDFMLRGDEAYGDALRDRVSAFGEALAASGLPAPARAEIKGLIETYRNAFMAYLVGASSLKEEADDLASIYGRLAPLAAEVKRGAADHSARAAADIAASRETTAALMAWGIGLTLLCAGILSWWVGHRIATPLRLLARAMERLAAGDLDARAPGAERRDEIGALARAFAVFRDTIVENGALTAEQAQARARGEAERRAEMHRLADGFETTVGGIAATVTEATERLRSTATALTGTAEATADRSAAASTAVDTAAAGVGTVAAAAEELGASVQEIGRQVSGAARTALDAVAEADHAAGLVRDLSAAAERVGDVVGLISGIAGQTNLLALNATIEAARAGEAGRGFAVVAAEVKTLSEQTARATDRIADQVGGIQAATEQAARAIGGVAARIREISGSAAAIAAAVEQQGAATREIVRNVSLAAGGADAAAGNVGGVARAVEATSAAADQVLRETQDLAAQSGRLSDEVGRFLGRVRAA